MSKEIVLCFLDMNSPEIADHWLNRFAARLAPKTSNGLPKIHVELLFKETNDTEGMACSIYYDKQVHYYKKRFSRLNWSFRSIYCSTQAYNKIKNYCRNAAGCKFNKIGYFLFWLGIRLSGQYPCKFGYRPRYFCSEIITQALKAGGVLNNEQPSVIHPETLYRLVAPASTLTTIRNWDQKAMNY